MKKRRVVSVGAVLAGGFLVFGPAIQTADATMPPQCMGWNSGYLCATDDAIPGSGLNVQHDNPYWTSLGWNDRADAFYNGGKYCGVTIYPGNNYTGRIIQNP